MFKFGNSGSTEANYVGADDRQVRQQAVASTDSKGSTDGTLVKVQFPAVGTETHADTAALQHQNTIALNAMKTGPLQGLDVNLASLYYQHSSQATNMSAFVAAHPVVQSGLVSIDGVQYVKIDATAKDGDGAKLEHQLEAAGMIHGAHYDGLAGGLMAVDHVANLLHVDDLHGVRESLIGTNTGSVTTQADSVEHADAARTDFGVTGTGITVGILSDSFNTSGNADNEATDIATGDLPATTTILQDEANGTDEGRAIGQLVHDLAPGSNIDFDTAYDSQAAFAQHIQDLADAGSQVEVDDVFYYTEPQFQDGVIAQSVENVVANDGVAYYSSAGNQGRGTGFEGVWHGASETIGSGAGSNYGAVTGQFMQFDNGHDYLPYNFYYYDAVTLSWDQPSASATTGGQGAQGDLDLYLTNQDGSIIYAESLYNNLGGDASDLLYLEPGYVPGNITTASLYLRVGVASGESPDHIKIVSFNNAIDTTGADNQNDGTTFGHSAATGAVSVAAAPFYTPTAPEPFSSGGPVDIYVDHNGNHLSTPDIRHTPQITAIDGGNTTFFGTDVSQDADTNPNFFGTSAAAPDAAAVAALMLQANSALTPEDLLHLLQDGATDMGDAGRDTRTGAGLVNADNSVGYATTLVISNDGQYQLDGTHLNDTITGGDLNNTINGGDGLDTIDGAGGDDRVFGNAGNDRLLGHDGADSLDGGQGNDYLKGGTGNDTLIGSLGADTLEGGNGSDIFKYRTAADSTSSSRDTITDFVSGTDKIDLSKVHTSSHDTYSITHSGQYSYVTVDLGGNGSNDMAIRVIGDVTSSDIIWTAAQVQQSATAASSVTTTTHDTTAAHVAMLATVDHHAFQV